MVKWRYQLGKVVVYSVLGMLSTSSVVPAVTFQYKHYKLDIWTTHWLRPRHYSCDCSGKHQDWCSGWTTVFGPFDIGTW